MAVSYARLIANIGLRLNAIVGTDAAALETAFKKTSQIVGDYESVDFPWTAIKDLVVMAESRYVNIIASVKDENGEGNHTWRALLHSVTASIANGAAIPSVSSTANQIVGVYGSVRDAGDGTPLERRSLHRVKRWTSETWRTRDRYEYAIVGSRLYHTRTNATIDVCTYNATTKRAAIDADTAASMLLPDVLEEALICEGVSMAFYDEEFPAQAAQYRAYSNDQIALIQAGGVTAPQRIAA